MRILLVSSNSSGIGGGERYLAYLAEGLRQLGHEVHALVGDHDYMDPVAGWLSAAGAKVRRERLVALGQRRLRFVSACLDGRQKRRLAAIYREIGPDVVHVNQQYDEDGLDLVLAARRASLPVVGIIHLPMCRDKAQRPLGRARAAWMKAWYRRVSYPKILCSAETAREFCEFYSCLDTVVQIDNATFEGGVPLVPASPRPPGWNGGAPVIGFVGRLDSQKDPLLLVRAWGLLRAALPEAKLLMVGAGKLRSEIERMVAAEGLTGEIHITGWEPDVRPWYRLMDVYALTSRFEGMPQSLIEAACDGLRIAAVLGPGVPGVLNHAAWAVPVPSRDPGRLADAIRLALASDAPTPSQLDATRAHFSVTRMARDVVHVYETAISGGSAHHQRLREPPPVHRPAGAADHEASPEIPAAGRVLNIIQCSNLGGMERSTLLALSQLQQRGLQCTLLSLNRVGALASAAEREGIHLEGVDYRGYAGWRSMRELRGRILDFGPDAVIMSGPNLSGMGTLPLICPKRRLLKVHFHHQGVKPRWQWRIIYRTALGLFPHITFCTDFIRGEAEDICPALRGVASTLRNPFQAHEPVSPSERSAARKALGLPADARIVGNAGWLIPRKRFDVFLRTVARVAAAEPDAVFAIAGDGSCRPSLEALAAELGIAGRVRWLGWQADLNAFYRSLDVLLFNSDWDALGRTPPEAMSFGIPVVASVNHGGLGELIESETHGFLSPAHNTETLSEQVIHLLSSPDEARRIGLAGRDRLLAWSPPGSHANAVCRMLGLP